MHRESNHLSWIEKTLLQIKSKVIKSKIKAKTDTSKFPSPFTFPEYSHLNYKHNKKHIAAANSVRHA